MNYSALVKELLDECPVRRHGPMWAYRWGGGRSDYELKTEACAARAFDVVRAALVELGVPDADAWADEARRSKTPGSVATLARLVKAGHLAALTA